MISTVVRLIIQAMSKDKIRLFIQSTPIKFVNASTASKTTAGTDYENMFVLMSSTRVSFHDIHEILRFCGFFVYCRFYRASAH